MSSLQSMSVRRSFYVLFAATAVCMISALFMMPFLPDDSYISFRYAESLAKGYGVTFNRGEPPVEGYSNFLWILFCAFVHGSGFDLPTFIPFVGALLAVLNVVVLWLIFQRRGLPPLQMLFPLVVLATSGPFLAYAISGMEMPLYSLILLLAVYCVDGAFATGRLRYFLLLAVLSALLSMSRPEGVAVFPVVAAAMILLGTEGKEKSQLHKTRLGHLLLAAAVFVVLVVVYNIWRVHYFGEILPTPLLSKGGGGKSLLYAWTSNIRIYFSKQGDYYPPFGYYFAALYLVAIVGYTLSNSRIHHKRTECVALALAVVHGVVYFQFRDWMPGMRYHSALVGLLLIPAVHVQTPFFESMGTAMTRAAKWRYWLVGTTLTLLSYSVLGELRVITKRMEVSHQECLVKLGKWLHEAMPPGAVLAVSDVGAIPYYSGFKTVDIHPESLTDGHIARNGFSIEYIYGRKPTVVIIPARSIFLPKFYPEHYAMIKDARFDRNYRLLGVPRLDWYNDRCYWIFVPARYSGISEDLMDRFPHGVGTIARIGNRS